MASSKSSSSNGHAANGSAANGDASELPREVLTERRATAGDIATLLGAELVGDAQTLIAGASQWLESRIEKRRARCDKRRAATVALAMKRESTPLFGRTF